MATRTEGRKSRILHKRDGSRQSSSPELETINGGTRLVRSKDDRGSVKVRSINIREILLTKEERKVAQASK